MCPACARACSPSETPKLANSQAAPAPTPHNYRAMRTERGQTLQALAPTSSQRRLNGLLHPAEPAPLPAQGWPIMGVFLHPLPTLLPSTCRSRLKSVNQAVKQSIRQSNPANQPTSPSPSPRSFGAGARREKERQQTLSARPKSAQAALLVLVVLVVLATWRWPRSG
jgi:hypothetical protein